MTQDLHIPTPPTINDIARVAKVSLATVDRVLNARPGVRAETVKKVNRAIEELGYVRDTAAANLARGRVYHFVFVLPSNSNEFLSALEAQTQQLAQNLRHDRTRITFLRVPSFDPVALGDAVRRIEALGADGVALMAPETPSVRDEITYLKSKGIAVVALVADIPSSDRDHYVGVDNIAAGRTAAQLLGRFLGPQRGSILVLTGSMLARDHLERRLGFDAVMARDFPHLSVLASLEGRDDPDLIERLMPTAMADNPTVVGIYSSAAGNEGLLRYFETQTQTPPPVVIAHELTPLSRGALAAQERIRIDVYLKENMPL